MFKIIQAMVVGMIINNFSFQCSQYQQNYKKNNNNTNPAFKHKIINFSDDRHVIYLSRQGRLTIQEIAEAAKRELANTAQIE